MQRLSILVYIYINQIPFPTIRQTIFQISALSISFIQINSHLTMAPGLVEGTGLQTSSSPVMFSVFPDGFKTSGQHPPIYSLVRSYADFPKTLTGPTVWKAEDYRENPELWTHHFTAEDIVEISDAADQFTQTGTSLTGISKVWRCASI